MSGSVQVFSNQVSKKSFYTFEDIDLRESHAVKLWELIQFKSQKSVSTVFLGGLHRVCLQK